MLFEDEVKSISELLTVLARLPSDTAVWFRGQAKAKWALVPSLGRPLKEGFDPITAESALMKKFKQNAAPYLTSFPSSTWEWMMLMQHHRVPTRLLDWSESPLTGLFFALDERPDCDGALWCLLPAELNKHANINFTFPTELPSFDDSDVLTNYAPETVSANRLAGIFPVAVMGVRNTPRMYAQLGAFTLTHREQLALETVKDGNHVAKIIIPAAAKTPLKNELLLLKITRLSLFPELDNVGLIAKEILA